MYRKFRQNLITLHALEREKRIDEGGCVPGDEVLLYSRKGVFLVIIVSASNFSVTSQRWLNSKEHKNRIEQHLWSDLKEVLR